MIAHLDRFKRVTNIVRQLRRDSRIPSSLPILALMFGAQYSTPATLFIDLMTKDGALMDIKACAKAINNR